MWELDPRTPLPRLFSLVERLQLQRPMERASFFDNTVILWCNELGIGNNHAPDHLPLMLAGSAGGYFKTGQAVTIPTA